MIYLKALLCLAAAVAVQGTVPASLNLFGARCDVVLVVLIAFSLAADPLHGALIGFIAGLLQGSAVGLSLGSFIVTRTLVGFFAGVTTTRFFSENPIVTVASAFWLTLACEIMFLMGNPGVPFAWAVWKTLGEGVLNSVLSFILYLVIQQLHTHGQIRKAVIRARL